MKKKGTCDIWNDLVRRIVRKAGRVFRDVFVSLGRGRPTGLEFAKTGHRAEYVISGG